MYFIGHFRSNWKLARIIDWDREAKELMISKLCISSYFLQGSVILLENLRFHLEEEGKGVDNDGNKV